MTCRLGRSLINMERSPKRPGEIGMDETRDVLTSVRTARFHALVAELIPKIRRLGPELSDQALIETAERLADHRLASEGLGRREI